MTWHPQSYPTRATSTWPAAPHCHLVAAWCRHWSWRSIIGAACSSNVGHQDTPVVARLVATVSLWCWNFRNKLGEIWIKVHVDALLQEICNSSAVAMVLHLPCTNPSIYVSHHSTKCIWEWCLQNNILTPFVATHMTHQAYDINPLRANFFRGNISICLHFMSLLHIDLTQVLKILPQVRPGPIYSTQSISWLLMSWRRLEPGHQQPWYWPS